MEYGKTKAGKQGFGAAGILAKLILAALAVYAVVTLVQLQEQIQTAREKETYLTAQVQGLTDQNEALRSDIASAGDQEKLEGVARKALGMVKSGEKVFYDTGS